MLFLMALKHHYALSTNYKAQWYFSQINNSTVTARYNDIRYNDILI